MGSAPSGARRPTPPSALLSKPAAATAGAPSPPSAMPWHYPRPGQPARDQHTRRESLPSWALAQEPAKDDVRQGHQLAILICSNCHIAAPDQPVEPILHRGFHTIIFD